MTRQTASLFWGDIAAPFKLTLLPVYDLHTGFPYSAENEFREYVGPRNSKQFPRFSSLDLQVSRPVSLHLGERHLKARAGFGVFNVFNHFNPRDVQNDVDSQRFGEFFNDAWREYRGKLGISVLIMRTQYIFGTFLLLFTATALSASDGDPLPAADTVVARMLAQEAQRQMLAAGYHGMRRYVLDNERMHKHAEMLVRVQCDADGTKHFEVVDLEGWKGAQKHVLHKMLESEAEASYPQLR